MEAVWRFRIMVCMAFAIIIFGDFLGYGSIRAEKHINRQAPIALREKPPEIHLEDGLPLPLRIVFSLTKLFPRRSLFEYFWMALDDEVVFFDGDRSTRQAHRVFYPPVFNSNVETNAPMDATQSR